MVNKAEVSAVMKAIAKKRWKNTSKEQRSEIGRARVKARWENQTAKLTQHLVLIDRRLEGVRGFRSEDELLDIDAVAAWLQIPKSTVDELTRNRSRIHGIPLPCFKVGRRLKFNRSAVVGWLDELEKASGR